MLAHPTQERLTALGLIGMAKAFDDQRRQPDITVLSFEERLALLLDREAMERENKRLVARLRFAALRQEAVVSGGENPRIGGASSLRCGHGRGPETWEVGSPARCCGFARRRHPRVQAR